MDWLIGARFVMGVGMGAEVVCGYVMISEFVPPGQRGRWAGGLAVLTNSALFFANVFGAIIIPSLGWRWMFGLVGAGALVIWLFRRGLPESPRWLESKGRADEAESVMAKIEAEASRSGPLLEAAYHPTPVLPHQPLSVIFSQALLVRFLVGLHDRDRHQLGALWLCRLVAHVLRKARLQRRHVLSRSRRRCRSAARSATWLPCG